MQLIKSLYLTNRLFAAVMIIVLLFVAGYGLPMFMVIGKWFLFAIVMGLIGEIVLLYRHRKGMHAIRSHDAKLSNGDDNKIMITLSSQYEYDLNTEIIDEIPHQFQRRDISWKLLLPAGAVQSMVYNIRPTKRGEYHFGAINVFISAKLGLVQRRYRFEDEVTVPVYPSIIQMKKYQISAFTNNLTELGIKKIRRVGQTTEFDQIKEYVIGDDPRNINWKASAKSTGLMVNHYTDEKSQPVYMIIDKGRLMRSPFEGLTLLDYAINSTLVMANIAINKQDKAGVITFGNKMSSVVKADKKSGQMNKILELLYQQKTYYKESNFELLSTYVQRRITGRSLLLLYTNFDNLNSFRRQLPYLRSLSKKHLLVVIFFENTELHSLIHTDPEDTETVYTQIIAEQLTHEKQLIVKELKKYGIYAILTAPRDLNINTINKYLEFKARGMV